MKRGFLATILTIGCSVLLIMSGGCSTVHMRSLAQEDARLRTGLRSDDGLRIAGYRLNDTPYLPFDGVVRAVGIDSLELRGDAKPLLESEFNSEPMSEGPTLRFARSERAELGVVDRDDVGIILTYVVLTAFPTALLFRPFD